MKKLLILIFLLSGIVKAQDKIETSLGSLEINPVLHGTLVLDFGESTIYVDPYGGAEVFEGSNSPDYILITDIHGDHHNQKTLDGLDLKKSTIIAPSAVVDKLPEGKYKEVISIGNGERKSFDSFRIEAIPMYNLPETAESRHPKGRGNGYVLTIGDKKVYISGDTEDIPEMRALENIDVAFVCMNLPYTMSVDQAASAVIEFEPKMVYPYHYRGPDGLSDVEKFKKMVQSSKPQVDVRLRNWYPTK